jgi:hypothetical protein
MGRIDEKGKRVAVSRNRDRNDAKGNLVTSKRAGGCGERELVVSGSLW